MPKKQNPVHKRKRSPRATIKTVHHPEDADALSGSRERVFALRAEAYKLKLYGYSIERIGRELESKFELVGTPSRSSVSKWIFDATNDCWNDLKERHEEQIGIVVGQANLAFQKFFPIMMGEKAVEYEESFDGAVMTVVKIADVKDQIAASEAIRKWTETVCRVLGVGRVDLKGEGMTQDVAFEFIRGMFTTAIAKPGELIPEEKKATVLEIESGSPQIDAMGGTGFGI